jgi:hypothetical protein
MTLRISEKFFTVPRSVLEAAVPRSNERPSWVDHAVKFGEQVFLIVDVEERGDDVRLIVERAPHLF